MYSRKIRPLKSTLKTSAVYAQSSQRVVFLLQKRIDLSVCGTPWYVPRNAQSSPGGRRRTSRGPDGRVRGCAQEAKLPPWDAASLSELLSEVPGQAAPLSSPIEVTLHLYASLPSPGLIITHISERSWHGHNISPSSSYIWQQPIHLKRTSESLGC